MDWFRRHIRTGSKLALLALAVQFVLAFGHAHPTRLPVADSHAPSYGELVAAAIDAENGLAFASLPLPADDHGNSPHRALSDFCGICAVVAMSASALYATSPILHLPEAVTLLYRVTDAGLKHLDPGHAAFQPRGPPLS